MTSAPDLEHSLSGNYVRGITGRNRAAAVMAAAPAESAATYDALLTFDLLWLDRARYRKSSQPIGALRLFFPVGGGSVTAHHLKAVSASVTVELHDYDPATRQILRRDPQDAATLNRGWCPAEKSRVPWLRLEK